MKSSPTNPREENEPQSSQMPLGTVGGFIKRVFVGLGLGLAAGIVAILAWVLGMPEVGGLVAVAALVIAITLGVSQRGRQKVSG